MSQNSTTEIVTGGLVLAAAVGFLIYAAQVTGIGAGAGASGAYTLNASFRTADGVTAGTDVRLAGVKIGTVSGIRLNPETFRADTQIALRGDVEIPDDSILAISSEGLLGGNFVEVLPGGSPFVLEAGDGFAETQGSVSLITLLLRFVSQSGE
jgi:phospholipid/cholesterol/gamma-HCH transport system substrate-binding protein